MGDFHHDDQRTGEDPEGVSPARTAFRDEWRFCNLADWKVWPGIGSVIDVSKTRYSA